MIFLIEPSESPRDAFGAIFALAGRTSRLHPDFGSFLDSWNERESGVVLISARLGAETALDVLRHLRGCGVDLPTIMYGSDPDIPTVVRMMREGAEDYLAEPVAQDRLFASIDAGLAEERRRSAMRTERLAAMEKLGDLTPREKDVLERLLQGDRNKAVAAHFGIAPKTVEHHRAAILRKLGAKTLAAAAVTRDAAQGRQ